MEKFTRVHCIFNTKVKGNFVIDVEEKKVRPIITYHVINICKGRNDLKKENQLTIECLEMLVCNV